MDTQSILDAYSGMQWYLDDKRFFENKIKEYQQDLDITNEVLEIIKNVDLVYNNAPIHIHRSSDKVIDYSRVDENNAGWRRANLYNNINDSSLYGIRLYLNKRRIIDVTEEVLLSKDIKGIKEATRLCLEYVSRDCSPAEFKYDYERQKI